MAQDGDTPVRQLSRVWTGIGVLDFCLGGGIVDGRTTLISGSYKTGKTTVLAYILAEYQRRERASGRNRKAVLFATEDKYDEAYFGNIGVDTDPAQLIVEPPEYLEITGNQVLSLFRKDPTVGLIIIDSLRMMATMTSMERLLEEPQYAPEAKIINSMLVQANVEQGKRIRSGSPCSLLLINHEARGIASGGMPAPVIIPRGAVQMFTPTTRVRMKSPKYMDEVTADKNFKIPLGVEFNFTVEANLFGRSKIGGKFRMFQSAVGEHKPGQLCEYGFWMNQGRAANIITGRGAEYKVGEETFSGREGLIKAWETDAEVYRRHKECILPAAIDRSMHVEKRGSLTLRNEE